MCVRSEKCITTSRPLRNKFRQNEKLQQEIIQKSRSPNIYQHRNKSSLRSSHSSHGNLQSNREEKILVNQETRLNWKSKVGRQWQSGPRSEVVSCQRLRIAGNRSGNGSAGPVPISRREIVVLKGNYWPLPTWCREIVVHVAITPGHLLDAARFHF